MAIKNLKHTPKSDWNIVDGDFRSLQMVLAFADCAYNRKGIDQIAYDIYGPGGSNDAHAVTGFNTFVHPLKREVIEIDDGNGFKTSFLPEQKIKIKRNGEDLTIKGEEFLETDVFVEKC